MNYFEKSVELHRAHKGKLEIVSSVPLETLEDLSLAYTPGVAEPCRRIANDAREVYELTGKSHSIAIVTDGSAVLGLGNIGPLAALPVMEGKAILFKRFANIDGYPICLQTQDTEEIIETVKRISPGFGAINLEDISAPRCFEIERRLVEELDIPVMHDDQHGTAVVVLAGLLNALKVLKKSLSNISVVISGAGAGGLGIANMLLDAGVKQMAILDSRGMIAPGREEMNPYKEHIAQRINGKGGRGDLAYALEGADVFIGVSQPNILKPEMIACMKDQPIIFALSNPIPEIMPDLALQSGAAIVATGRSDFPNQVNNALAYPGIFKGAMAVRKKITPAMKVAAAYALAGRVSHPTAQQIIPSLFDTGLVEAIARAVQDVYVS